MSEICSQHQEKFITGCIKCNEAFCLQCLSLTTTLNCLDNKIPYAEYKKIQNEKIKQNIMEKLQMINQKKREIFERVENLNHKIESFDKEEKYIIDQVRSSMKKIENQITNTFRNSKAMEKENINILSFFLEEIEFLNKPLTIEEDNNPSIKDNKLNQFMGKISNYQLFLKEIIPLEFELKCLLPFDDFKNKINELFDYSHFLFGHNEIYDKYHSSFNFQIINEATTKLKDLKGVSEFSFKLFSLPKEKLKIYDRTYYTRNLLCSRYSIEQKHLLRLNQEHHYSYKTKKRISKNLANAINIISKIHFENNKEKKINYDLSNTFKFSLKHNAQKAIISLFNLHKQESYQILHLKYKAKRLKYLTKKLKTNSIFLINKHQKKNYEELKNVFAKRKNKFLCKRLINSLNSIFKIHNRQSHVKVEDKFRKKRIKFINTFLKNIIQGLKIKIKPHNIDQLLKKYNKKFAICNFLIKIRSLAQNILKKSAKQVPKLTFKKNPFRKKGRPCSFEAKRVYSPYLFWVEHSTPSKIHVTNLILNWNSNFNLYNVNAHELDAEEHCGKIYTCGGHYSGYLTTCYSLDLSSIKKANPIQICNLPDGKSYHCLLSTALYLFSMGGLNSSGNYTNTCYRLLLNPNPIQWQTIPNLNFNRGYITPIYVYPGFIYIVGDTSSGTLERFDIKKNDKWDKFDKIQVNARQYGSSCYIDEKEILFFGGNNCKGRFFISEMKYFYSDISSNFNSYYYNGSRLRLYNQQYQIVSRNNNKRVYIDLKNYETMSITTDF